MSSRLFIGTTPKLDNGWMMCHCGCANDSANDYVITTNYLKADEVPDECMDAKSFSRLCAGLLNAYYSGVDVTKWDANKVVLLGMPNEEVEIPHHDNTELPF